MRTPPDGWGYVHRGRGNHRSGGHATSSHGEDRTDGVNMSRTSKWRGRRAALVAAGVVVSAGFGATASPVDAKQAPTQAQCNNRVNNTANRLLECVNVAGVRQHLATLQRIADANGGTRSAGTPGYDASVDYAVRILKNAGYDVTVQPFDFTYTEDLSSLTDDTNGVAYESLANQFTPFVSGTATGQIVPVDVVIPPTPEPSSSSGCEPEDFADFPAGGIALVQRGHL